MIKHINNLPKLNLTSTQAVFYDVENVSLLQEVTMLYHRVYELIELYNGITDELNRIEKDMIKVVSDLFNQALEDGSITAELKEEYNELEKALTLSINATNNE